MNERIRELAEQAGCKVMDDGEWYIPSATGVEKIVYTKGIGLEKFAELIVKECVQEMETSKRCDPYTGELFVSEYNRTIDEQISVLKEHFGVEE